MQGAMDMKVKTAREVGRALVDSDAYMLEESCKLSFAVVNGHEGDHGFSRVPVLREGTAACRRAVVRQG